MRITATYGERVELKLEGMVRLVTPITSFDNP